MFVSQCVLWCRWSIRSLINSCNNRVSTYISKCNSCNNNWITYGCNEQHEPKFSSYSKSTSAVLSQLERPATWITTPGEPVVLANPPVAKRADNPVPLIVAPVWQVVFTLEKFIKNGDIQRNYRA